VKIGSKNPAAFWTWKGRPAGYLLFPLAAAAAGIAVYAISAALAAPAQTHALPGPGAPPDRVARVVSPPPGPAEFASDFVGTANAYAKAHGDPARLANPDCVEASPGHYMCSYAVTRPGRPRECHLIQATWTPHRASTFTITLSGRVRRCRTLREAIRSLR
jgi:hypothetical protein